MLTLLDSMILIRKVVNNNIRTIITEIKKYQLPYIKAFGNLLKELNYE